MATQSATILENTHSRYRGSRDKAYTRSYRVIRLMVGFLGISLPLIFIFVEAYLLKGGVHVRGSLSAYYHSPLQDVFVGGLCVIGVLLATYMAGEKNTLDFWFDSEAAYCYLYTAGWRSRIMRVLHKL